MPQQGGAPLYYVLSLSPQGGFVVVAGDEQMGPVVGYSAEGVYDPASLPEALTEWLEAQAAQTAAETAQGGIAELEKLVNALMVIDNQKLEQNNISMADPV